MVTARGQRLSTNSAGQCPGNLVVQSRTSMFRWFFKLASTKNFYRLAEILGPWLTGLCALLLGAGLFLGLFVAPTDYEQGESYRIIFVHVPSAWMSMFVYMVMAFCSVLVLVWKMKLADVVAQVSAPIGASFTFCAGHRVTVGQANVGYLVGVGCAPDI